jgi:translation initiation factor RLI1
MVHAREKGKSARRIKEVVEIISVDSKTQDVNTNLVFRWSPTLDNFEKVNERKILQTLVQDLELDKILDRPLEVLSGGELQRVAIAIA